MPPLVLIALTIAWGVFSFGAVYAWAYWPLLLCALMAGVAGVWRLRRPIEPAAAWAAAMILASVAVQLVPLPYRVLAAAAPRNAGVVSQLSLTYASAGGAAWHALSVNPALTAQSLVFLSIGVAWIAGVSAALSSSPALARRLAIAIGGVGAIVAILGLAQKAISNGKIYWFWESPFKQSYNYFGPFVNRNHFAGWMVLAVSVGMGYLLGRIATPRRSHVTAFRERVLWLGTREASGLVLIAIAVGVMALSLVWTLSRSGMASGGAALLVIAVACLTGIRGAWRRIAAAGVVVLVCGAAPAWRGVDAVAASYGDTQSLEWRLALWQDTVAPLRDFWKAGSGLNTYGTVMLVYPQTDTHVHAEQAHNDYLQLAVEGGLLVCLPVLAAVGLLARLTWRRLRQPQPEMTWWVRMGAIAGICGMAIQETSEFSLQIPGVALLFAVLVAIAIHEPARLRSRTHTTTPITVLSTS